MLRTFGDIDVGMINPPYSLDKKDDSSIRVYPIEQSIRVYHDKNKKLKKKVRELKKKDAKEEIAAINKEINENLIKNALVKRARIQYNGDKLY